jgi:putative nucleotidyltransferase with HDIG domain
MEIPFLKIFRKKRNVSRNDRAEKYNNNHARKHNEVLKEISPRLAFVVVFAIVGVLLLPPTQRSKDVMFKAGMIADRDIIAPFNFDVPLAQGELGMAKDQAAASVLPVYERNRVVEIEIKRDLNGLLDSLTSVVGHDTLPRDQKLDIINSYLPYLSKNSAVILLEKNTFNVIKKSVAAYQSQILLEGLIDNSGPLRRGDFENIAVLDGDKEIRARVKDVNDQGQLDDVIREKSVSQFGKNRGRAQVFFEIVRAYLLPNLILNLEETQRRRVLAIEKVPGTFRVSKNERIIAEHDKVTKEQENILRALEDARSIMVVESSPLTLVGLYTAEILRLIIFGLIFGSYLYIFRRKLYYNLSMVGAMFAVMLLFLVLTAVVIRFSLNEFLIPVAFVSLMLAALFDFRLGLATTVMASLLIPLVTNVPYSVGFVALLAGAMGVVGLKHLRSRSHFYTVFLYITLAYIVGVISVELGQLETFEELYTHIFWGVMSGLFASVSVMFLLPIFENIFNMTTRFTLLELTDLNKPILKRLAMEARGTYHHSMLIGNLVDSVAGDVGADPLRARVMAYYHDIGKILKTEYFAENQDQGFNKHEKIKPQMSALILLSHVKDGVELAREEKLPPLVIDAIREHHGTTVMAYFYQKALETDSHSSVNMDDFRYPGPRPRSKESALLMLADSVEAAVRSLKEPAPSHIRNMVVKLVDGRAQDGELDDSGLTLLDLAIIRDRFIKILSGIYHARLRYPGQESEESKQGEVVAKPVG